MAGSWETPSAPSPMPAKPQRRNYFARHWHGELSLPVAFWINSVPLTGLFVVVSGALQAKLELYLGRLTGLAFVGGIWGPAGILTIWQLVGIWRAAGSHSARTGKVFWVGAARVLVVIGAIASVWRYATLGVPLVFDHVKIALGDSALGTFELRVLNDGREIEYSGAIVYGAAEALEKLLQQTPQAKVIRLQSTGGRITEARRMLDVVRRSGIDSYVPRLCLSACTLVFVGGKNRYIHEKAELGFHAGSIRGVSEADIAGVNSRMVDHVVRMGVDRAFATRAYFQPSSGMWYPTSEELIASRFATAIAQGQ